MPKNGGTFLRDLVQKHGNKDKFGHLPARKIIQKVPGVNLYGTIRDPWTWYASWYAHCTKNRVPCEKMRRFYGPTFKVALKNVLNKTHLDDGYSVMNVYEHCPSWRDCEGSLYTHWFEMFYGDHVKTFIDTAQLYEGVEELLGHKVDPRRFPPLNTSNRKVPVNEMYDQELIDLVWEKDGPLAKKLGFTPFSKSTHGPVIRLDA